MTEAELALERAKKLAFLMTERFSMNPISAKLLNEAWRLAFPDEVAVARRMRAMVEALEKAQETIAFQQGEIKALLSSLESRTVTVKLPDIMPPEAAPAHYWGSGESMAYADGYNKSAADLKTSFAQACSSAGVNVEFE